jgi:hypothetical protein
MADFFGNIENNPNIDLGPRILAIKNASIISDSCFSIKPDNTVTTFQISSYGKSLLNVSDLNGLIRLIEQGDSSVSVTDTGAGEVYINIDNQAIAVWRNTGLFIEIGKYIYCNELIPAPNSNGIFVFHGQVNPSANNTHNLGDINIRWDRIAGNEIHVNRLKNSGGDINVDTGLITNGPLYINNSFIPFTGGFPVTPKDIGTPSTRWANVFSDIVDTGTIVNSAGFIAVESLLKTNAALLINNGFLPYGGTLQDIGSNISKFNNVFANNSHQDKAYLNRIISPSHLTGALVFTDSQYLTTISCQEANNDTNYKNLVIKAGGQGELLLQNNSLVYCRNFYNPTYVRPDGLGADCSSFLNIESNHIIPTTASIYNLGADTKRWLDIYSINSPTHGSDFNLKKDIIETELGLDFINKLEPVQYEWREGQSNRTHYGFIAQQVRDILGHKANKNKYGMYVYSPATTTEVKNQNGTTEIIKQEETFSLRYTEFISPIVKSIQQLSNKVNILENNTNVVGDTVILNQTQTPVNSSSSSSSSAHLQKKIDELISRVFTLENSSKSNDEEEESESDYSMLNSLQTRVHTLEQQNQKLENKLKKLTTAVNKLLKNQ